MSSKETIGWSQPIPLPDYRVTSIKVSTFNQSMIEFTYENIGVHTYRIPMEQAQLLGIINLEPLLKLLTKNK